MTEQNDMTNEELIAAGKDMHVKLIEGANALGNKLMEWLRDECSKQMGEDGRSAILLAGILLADGYQALCEVNPILHSMVQGYFDNTDVGAPHAID